MSGAGALLLLQRHDVTRSSALVLLIAGLCGLSAMSVLPLDASALASFALLLAGGLVAGWLAGLLGIGGALVTLPVLYIALPGFGIDAARLPATAVATALVAMVPTTLAAAWRQHRQGALHLGWLRRLMLPMTLGALAGAFAASRLNGPVLGFAFAAQSIWHGGQLLCERARTSAGDDGAEPPARARGLPHWLAGPAMAGFCACVGMGGGSLVWSYLRRRQVGFRSAVATGSALNLCIAVGGSVAFLLASNGAVDRASAFWPAGMLLGAGAVVAAPLGVIHAHGVRSLILRRGVALANIVAALVLVATIVRLH